MRVRCKSAKRTAKSAGFKCRAKKGWQAVYGLYKAFVYARRRFAKAVRVRSMSMVQGAATGQKLFKQRLQRTPVAVPGGMQSSQ
jgi:hypothetical protein